MSNAPTSRFESSLRLLIGFLLWGVSATLTLVLLISIGDGALFSRFLLGIVAIALEGAKILSWRKGGVYRTYATALIILSGIASLGASLQVVEKSKFSVLSITRDDVRSSPSYLANEGELESIDSEIAALVSRLKLLPLDFTTATAQTESSLAALRDRKQGILDALATKETVGASHDDGNMVILLGRTIGLKPEILLLVLLLFVSASIEVGALLLTIPTDESGTITQMALEPSVGSASIEDTTTIASPVPSPSYAPPITPEDFLEAAKQGADLPYLHGRDTTAEKLGISYAEAKRLVGRLINDGTVVVEGKRLRLAPVKEEPFSTH
jgi:hypothetical protein